MIWAKFQSAVIGSFWLPGPPGETKEGEAWARGIAEGWELGREEGLEVVDIRLSKHPTEQTYSLDQVREFIKQHGESTDG